MRIIRVESEVVVPGEHFFHKDAGVQASHVSAGAEVTPSAQAHMLPRMRAGEADVIGGREVGCVSVRGSPQEHQPVPGAEQVTVEFARTTDRAVVGT